MNRKTYEALVLATEVLAYNKAVFDRMLNFTNSNRCIHAIDTIRNVLQESEK